MNSNQKEFVNLVKLLNIRTKEYNKLCDKFKKIKQGEINLSDEKLLKLKQLFKENHDEIVEINKKLKRINENADFLEKELMKKYDPAKLFKKK